MKTFDSTTWTGDVDGQIESLEDNKGKLALAFILVPLFALILSIVYWS